MAVAVTLAFLGTVSAFFGIVVMTMGRFDNSSMSINGWLVLIGAACYALSSFTALQVARARWTAGADALWQLAWSLFMAAFALVLASVIGPALLGLLVPGEHQWIAFALVVLAQACGFAASTLILLRVLARVIGAIMSVAAR
ncbi:MAG TPA: hypothetical protein VFL03_08840 [Candidatus Limnocylindrales bacterium]|nr:hypothetical protein [Candidatus Limnocylindrales bacterium]